MAIISNPLYGKEYNCLVTDLVNDFPPEDEGEEGSIMYVWDANTKELQDVFKKVFSEWYKL